MEGVWVTQDTRSHTTFNAIKINTNFRNSAVVLQPAQRQCSEVGK